MRIGAYVSAGAETPLETILGRFAALERRGLHTAWTGQLFAWDALSLLALASQHTERIELGSWVVPTPPRHPVALAQQAASVQAAAGGRLLLGLGVSHEAVVGRRLGLDASHPLRHMEEYLQVLAPLLAGEELRHEGPSYRLALRLERLATPPPLLLAALGPRMLELAGRRADGVALWLGGPRYLERLALPRLRRAAARAGRPEPRVVCGLPVAVTRAARARASVEAFLERSARLPAYRRVLERGGASSPAEVALIGGPAEVERGLARLRDLGVHDFHAVTFPVRDDPGAQGRTLDFLAGRAA